MNEQKTVSLQDILDALDRFPKRKVETVVDEVSGYEIQSLVIPDQKEIDEWLLRTKQLVLRYWHFLILSYEKEIRKERRRVRPS